VSNKKPNIPQNKKEFFLLSLDEKFYALDIEFNHTTILNMENLFLIIKFYSNNEHFLAEFILVISKDIEYNEDVNNCLVNIYHYVKLEKIKKMSYFDFKEWFYDLKKNDHEYLINKKYYGFRIVFNKNSIFYKEKNIYPSYPWNIKYKKLYIGDKTNNIKFEKWLYKNNKLLYIKWIKEKVRLYK